MHNEQFEQALRAAGLKATPGRVALLSAFPHGCEPVSAEYLSEHVPGVDQATVYRNLKTLEKTGLVRRVDIRTDAVLYELAGELTAGHHHHHIVCTSCGTIEAFEACGISSFADKALAASKRFKLVTEHSLELFGVCKSCARA